VTRDAPLGALIDLVLDHGAYERRVMADLPGAEAAVLEWRPHLVILDIDIGEGAGVAAIGGLKGLGLRLPVIGVTHRNTIEARLVAFERGIDDLLAIPFPPEELVARCIGVMWRVHGQRVPFLPEISVGALRIDLLHQRLRADDTELELTRIESALLYVLAANADQVMTRDQLLDYVWGWDREVGSNLIDRHIFNLRAKLGDDRRHARFLETIPGEGYRFKGAASRRLRRDERANTGHEVV
jgi:two-component system response regulator RegX3